MHNFLAKIAEISVRKEQLNGQANLYSSSNAFTRTRITRYIFSEFRIYLFEITLHKCSGKLVKAKAT